MSLDWTFEFGLCDHPLTHFRRESLSDPVVEETEPTNVVSTPDLYISGSDDESVGHEDAGGYR